MEMLNPYSKPRVIHHLLFPIPDFLSTLIYSNSHSRSQRTELAGIAARKMAVTILYWAAHRSHPPPAFRPSPHRRCPPHRLTNINPQHQPLVDFRHRFHSHGKPKLAP